MSTFLFDHHLWCRRLATYWLALDPLHRIPESEYASTREELKRLAAHLYQCLSEHAVPLQPAHIVGQGLALLAQNTPHFIGSTFHWLAAHPVAAQQCLPMQNHQLRLQDVFAAFATGFAEAMASNRSTYLDDQERVHIAREIHDGPLQDVYRLQLSIAKLGNSIDGAALREAQDATQHLASTLRHICATLRPPAVALVGLSAAIRSHAESLQQVHPELRFLLELQPDRVLLAERIRLHLFRIYQSAVTNVLRHAQAHSVRVNFCWDAEHVVLSVQDDGIGFCPPQSLPSFIATAQYGLIGMQERAVACGGTLDLITAPDQGTTVVVRLPGVVVAQTEHPYEWHSSVHR